MAKTIKNPTNYQIAQELCRTHPNSKYAELLKYDPISNELGVTDFKVFLDEPQIANEFITDMANKIVVQRTYDLFRGYKMPFEIFMVPMSRLGDAEELLTSKLAESKNYDSTTKDPFNATKPSIVLSWIKTEDKVECDVVLTYDIWAGAFTNEGSLGNISAIILKNLRDSILNYVYEKIKTDLSNTTNVSKSLTIETIADAGEVVNAQKAYEQIMKLANDMTIPSVNFNTSGVKTMTPKGSFVLILNSRYLSSFNVNVLASLFNSDKIAMGTFASEVILADMDTAGDTKCVGVLLDKEAYMWGYRLNVTQSIVNPKTLEINTYQHDWVKRAVVPFRQCVRLVTA